jgi:hypothetical protein
MQGTNDGGLDARRSAAVVAEQSIEALTLPHMGPVYWLNFRSRTPFTMYSDSQKGSNISARA